MRPSIFTVRPGVKTVCSLQKLGLRSASSPLNLLKLARQCLPVSARTQALQDVDFVGVRADQDSRLTSFHAAKNARRRVFGGSTKKPFKPGNVFLALGSRNRGDRKSTRLNSSHDQISYAVFCLKKKKKK